MVMITVLIIEVIMMMMMMMMMITPVEGNEKLCLPGLIPFLQAYISHYFYKEVHVIFNGTEGAQIVAAGRMLLTSYSSVTVAFINLAQNPDALLQVIPVTSSPGQASSFPASASNQDHVHNHRKPLFVAMLPTAIALYDAQKINVWEASRRGSWLLIGEDLEILTPTHYQPLDNQVMVGVWGRGDGVALWETYQAAPNLPQRVSKVGHWQLTDAQYNYCLENGSKALEHRGEREGLNNATAFFPTENYITRRKNLSGLHLRCVTESWNPFTLNKLTEIQGQVEIGGYMGEMFDLLREKLGFTYCRAPSLETSMFTTSFGFPLPSLTILSPDDQYGSLINGKWTGLVGEVVEKRADVIVAALDKTYQRSLALDFCYPYGDLEYHMIIRTPEPHMWDKFTRQLEGGSWLAYLAFLLAIPFIYYLLAARSPVLEPVTLQEAWFTMQSLTLNQGNMEVSGPARRLLQISVVATSWLMIAFYTSVLVSSLAVPILSPPFTDTEGLLKAGTHTLGLEKGNAEEERLKTSKHPNLQRVWSRLTAPYPDNLVGTIDEGIKKVVKEKFVFLIEKHYYVYNLKENCQLYQLPETIFRSSAAMALQKDSPLLLLFNHEIFSQHVAGLVDRSRTHFEPVHPLCILDSTGPINIRTMSTAFLVLAVVLPFALLILLLEIYLHRHLKKPRREGSQIKEKTEGTFRFHLESKEEK
ncbi:probable glutamate receptor [Scylla paramamosain]|uniref:probable glutamate receptor n=1 Tax=Scylla paramamosain TaxID=85552 RepID=UPI0030833C04